MNDFALEIKAKALMKLKQEADQLIDLLGNLRESYNLMTLAQVLKKKQLETQIKQKEAPQCDSAKTHFSVPSPNPLILNLTIGNSGVSLFGKSVSVMLICLENVTILQANFPESYLRGHHN